jgi:hypothetical protein
VYTLLQNLMPEYDIVMMIVNDAEYGGAGGFPAITSINSSAPEIVIHELGHSFAGLGDEYDAPFPGYPDVEEPNTTRETRREFIKWRPWVWVARRYRRRRYLSTVTWSASSKVRIIMSLGGSVSN